MFNVDKQRFYTILWLGKSAWSRLIKLLGFTPFPFSSTAFPLLLQTHEQRTAHTPDSPARTGQQPWSQSGDLRPCLYPTTCTSCSLCCRRRAAPLAGGTLTPQFLMLWVGWRWQAHFPSTAFWAHCCPRPQQGEWQAGPKQHFGSHHFSFYLAGLQSSSQLWCRTLLPSMTFPSPSCNMAWKSPPCAISSSSLRPLSKPSFCHPQSL